jgi:putative membrane protein
MKAHLMIGLSAALALAACSGGGDANSDEANTAPDEQASPTATAEAPAPDASTPQGFVAMAASSDMYEIEAGRLAQQNGKAEAVKSFGEMMVMDHTNSSAKLKAAVTEAGNGLMVPAEMTAKHQSQLTELQNAGDDFDATYARQQVMAHQEALSLLQNQAQSGTAAPLKAFAAQTAPVVETHLKQAQSLPAGGSGAAQ